MNRDDREGAALRGNWAQLEALRAEVVRLTGENERLREQKMLNDLIHGPKGRERVARLVAENEALKQARRLLAEVQNGLTCESVHHVKADQHEFDEPCPVLARIDAFLEATNA